MDATGGRLSGWEARFVDAARVARLATITPHGTPHIVPVCFARSDGDIYVAVDEKPKRSGELARVRNLRVNPRAALLFDDYSDDWTQLAWVRLDCAATVIETGGEEPAALALLRGRYPQYEVMALESLPLLRFAIDRVTSWRWGGTDAPSASPHRTDPLV